METNSASRHQPAREGNAFVFMVALGQAFYLTESTTTLHTGTVSLPPVLHARTIRTSSCCSYMDISHNEGLSSASELLASRCPVRKSQLSLHNMQGMLSTAILCPTVRAAMFPHC
eukprot:4838032-Amphidinium_carterae.1